MKRYISDCGGGLCTRVGGLCDGCLERERRRPYVGRIPTTAWVLINLAAVVVAAVVFVLGTR